MAARSDNEAVAFSEKVFERLLAAYPKTHREEYGAAMAQLFRDQCRDAWSESRGWGLTKLWLRVLPDVIGTSLLEHLETIKERKFMLNRITALFRSTQSFKFLTVFTAVFLLVVITATIVTFILPESFAGTARISAMRHEIPSGVILDDIDPYFIQTEFEVIRSEVVLGKVIEKLNLNAEWGKKHAGGERLKTSETLAELKRCIDLRSIRNTSLIEIRAYSDKPEEAARIANAIAYAYNDFRYSRVVANKTPGEIVDRLVEIVDRATPNPRPVRPNKPLNIAIGVVLGIVLGLIACGGVAGIAFLTRRNSPPKIAS